jgi:catechol 2,3-dioxygenase
MTTQPQQQSTHTQGTPLTAEIDPGTQVGVVALTVANLDRSVAFYTDAIGFAVLQRQGSAATLGASGKPLLLLKERPGARPWPHDQYAYTGLYHFAILVPTRADLGQWLRHWLEQGYPAPGQGDHLVSEALYLSDPDGNGIEIYRDRPRSEWRWINGSVQMATDPVDIRGVLTEAARRGQAWTGMAAGTRVGHVHLQVGDIPQAEAFYHGVLGFDVVAQMPSALFVSAGGYHHHIGMNTWHSRSAGPRPEDTAGLRFFSLEMPSEEARAAVVARVAEAGLARTESHGVAAVRDPWSNTILLHVGPAADAQQAETLAAATA